MKRCRRRSLQFARVPARIAMLCALALACAETIVGQTLQTIRAEVRGGYSESPVADATAASSSNDDMRRLPQASDEDDAADATMKYASNPLYRDPSLPSNSLTIDTTRLGVRSPLFALTAPFVAPPALLGDRLEWNGYFPRYPYADDLPGAMQIENLDRSRFHSTSARLTFDYLNDFDDVQRYGGRLLVSTRQRLDFDAEWNSLHEELLTGCDHFQIGDLNLVYRFGQSERWQFRSGFGANWLYDRRRADWGFNWTYSVDHYPRRPWVISSVIDWGTLGHTELFHARATGGVVWHRLELFSGYDARRIGGTWIQGPVFGSQWFF